MNRDERIKLETILEGMDGPAIVLGTDYRILAGNRAYRETYGISGTLEHRRCFEVSHGIDVPCDQAGESCPLAASLESGQRQRVLHLHHTPRGEEHVDVETVPVANAQGRIEYLIEILHRSPIASSRASADTMVGRSPQFNRQLELINRVAPSETAVLLHGESGTGKELVAKAIHEHSGRAGKPFVTVECSGLTEALFESELYGHERGAFTGAHYSKTGLVEAAQGGTLFLDEIGDVPLNLQVKLLRLLETGTYRRVGSVDTRQADFRLVTATHRDLAQMVEAGSFRRDLFYRISVFPIALPPLRERPDDIPLLAESLLLRLAPGRRITFADTALACLQRYQYPGNIRELRNLLERAVLLADDDTLLPCHLPPAVCPGGDPDDAETQGITLLSLAEMERRHLRRALVQIPTDRNALAKALGISRRTLFRKLQELRPAPGRHASDK